MVMLNIALICALLVLINSQYASNMHANKQRENRSLNKRVTFFFKILYEL